MLIVTMALQPLIQLLLKSVISITLMKIAMDWLMIRICQLPVSICTMPTAIMMDMVIVMLQVSLIVIRQPIGASITLIVMMHQLP